MSLLSFVLFVVVLVAVRDVRSRRGRTTWDATLDVAIVLVHAPGAEPVSETSIDALRERAPALEARLGSEMERHGRTGVSPFRFRVLGPVVPASARPEPDGEGIFELVRYTLAMREWLGDVDPRAGVIPEHFDTRIYVSARRPASATRSTVEGRSEHGGRVGVVDVELDETMVDLTLFVVAHELMHTLGAEDAYEPTGRIRIPEGLVEPEREPLYPQRFAEIMARGRAVSAGSEVLPETLNELGVGDVTAKAIGWKR